MRILVTGSSGFIGSNLVRELSKDFKIVTFDLKNDKREDVRNLNYLLKKSKGCDAIVHLAALTSNLESLEKPHEYFTTNVIGTLNVLEVGRRLKIKKIINVSSSGVGARTPYNFSKLLAEELCNFYSKKFKLKVISLRLFNVYGPGDKKSVIYKFIKGLKNNNPLIVYGDGKQVRDFIHVKDVIKVIKKLLEKDFSLGIYEVGSGKGTSVRKLIKILEKITGKKPRIVYKKLPYEEIKYSVAKNTIVKNPIELEEGVLELWNLR